MGQGQDTGGTRLGQLIGEERRRRSLSRLDLAKLIRAAAAAEGEVDDRTSDTSVKRWENGLVPRADHLRWLADALKLPVERLTALANSGASELPEMIGPAGPVDEDRLSFALESGHVDHYAMDDLVGLLRHYVSHAQGFAP